MTITIKGRNRHADTALTRVTVRDKYRTEILVIEGGYIEKRGMAGEFVLAAKHPSATDEEHDSAYVALIDGAGLTWQDMLGPTHTFTGALLSAKFYAKDPTPEDSCEDCEGDEAHGFLEFTPPEQPKFPVGAYFIEVEHLQEAS